MIGRTCEDGFGCGDAFGCEDGLGCEDGFGCEDDFDGELEGGLYRGCQDRNIPRVISRYLRELLDWRQRFILYVCLALISGSSSVFYEPWD